MFPVFGPLCGHDFLHAMHAVHEANHLKKNHEHSPHDHSLPKDTAEQHPDDIHLISYIRDHFHGELQVSSKKGTRLKRFPVFTQAGISIFYNENSHKIISLQIYEQPSTLHRNDLYLKTQRLRIGL
ncbi:MAG: hypothetical protein ABIJ59_15660 [Pseudomonadota bacterium]